ncbi:hypothetical protein [Candidatus Liberibacter africanus]|uniref:hypothetical protein n=1 Tax=Liberibacter africanus TaxID=34020 RepID=UPI001FD00ED1|nr:hypothetical protein [Candidatus Liberibacter africanus]
MFIVCVISITSSQSWAISSQIQITVNGEAITDGDIARRIALLKLEEINGELGKRAEQELIMETLKSQEIAKYGMILNEDTINYFLHNMLEIMECPKRILSLF